jgi:hypothetical protein
VGHSQHAPQQRLVNWLPTRPQWHYVDSSARISMLSSYAAQLGYTAFNSDCDLMSDIIECARLSENSPKAPLCSTR